MSREMKYGWVGMRNTNEDQYEMASFRLKGSFKLKESMFKQRDGGKSIKSRDDNVSDAEYVEVSAGSYTGSVPNIPSKQSEVVGFFVQRNSEFSLIQVSAAAHVEASVSDVVVGNESTNEDAVTAGDTPPFFEVNLA